MILTILYATILVASSVGFEECLWKACDADDGAACFKTRNLVDGTSEVKMCWGEDKIFNPLCCVYRDKYKVCITEDEMVEEAEALNSEFDTHMICSGKGWKGAIGQNCFKRLSNDRLKTYEHCKDSCEADLIESEIAAPDSVAKNLYMRYLGPETNSYWVALTLNDECDGWQWLHDESPLTEEQSFFPVSIAEKIAEIKAANGGVLARDQACVIQTNGSYEFNGSSMAIAWSTADCNSTTQCMCQSDAKLNVCEWKSCKASKGLNCYKHRVRGKWKTEWCQNEGEIFNVLVCATKNETEVCIPTETESDEVDILDIDTDEYLSSNFSCVGSWKGFKGPHCYKRFANDNTKDFEDCRVSCLEGDDLVHSTEILQPDSKIENIFARQVGFQHNVYWIGLELNDAGDGWNWLSDGSPLTQESSGFAGTIEDEINKLKALHGDDIPVNESCVMTENDDDNTFVWTVGSCDAVTQCMCQRPAWTPDMLNSNGNLLRLAKKRKLKSRVDRKQKTKQKKIAKKKEGRQREIERNRDRRIRQRERKNKV